MNLAFFFYNIIIQLLYLIFRILGFFNQKIACGIRGRAVLFVALKQKIAQLPAAENCFLIHASSMGEYEQARPVIKLLRKRYPASRIVLSLFSPSAFDNIPTNPDVDIITYLPFDSLFAMNKFLQLIDPQVLLITRHDIWPNLVRLAKKRGTINFLIDASVHEGSLRHKPLIRNFNRHLFSLFDYICVISEAALPLMQKFLNEEQKIVIAGDTRFDQVVARAAEKPVAELLPEKFLSHKQVFIAGSTWPEDEQIVFAAYLAAQRKITGLKLIFVPHELTPAHLDQAMEQCRNLGIKCEKLSTFDTSSGSINALLVDKMGILANIYGAGKVAYVGGSFGPGVHSVIEAAAHKIPVTFGPRMRNSAEAIAMVDQQCGFMIQDADELAAHLVAWFGDVDKLQHLSQSAAQFVASQAGASEKIIRLIQKNVHPPATIR